MKIEIIRLLFDTGLFVLIWMIQLVVYPSFLYYKQENLVAWHKKYTSGLSLVVIPLMFGQLILAIYQTVQIPDVLSILNLTLVVAVWISTFTQFVPIHNAITKGKSTPQRLQQLVNRNWLRTVVWTFLFCWSLYFNL